MAEVLANPTITVGVLAAAGCISVLKLEKK
jgi:hypothetical protein